MASFVRFSAFRLAVAYIVLSMGVLGIVALPLRYAWRQNIADVRQELLKEDAQSMIDILNEQGIEALSGMIDARVSKQRTGNLIISLSDARAKRVAGNLSAPPLEPADTPGVFTSTVEVRGRPV